MTYRERAAKARRLIKQHRIHAASGDIDGFLFVVQGSSGRYLTAAIPEARAAVLRAPRWVCTCAWGRVHAGEDDDECAHALAAKLLIERTP